MGPGTDPKRVINVGGGVKDAFPRYSPKHALKLSGRAGQGRAGQGRAGQGRAGQGRAGQGRAGQGRASINTLPDSVRERCQNSRKQTSSHWLLSIHKGLINPPPHTMNE